MSDKTEKLLEQLRKSPANCSRSDLERLYIGFGFEIIRKTKHTFARHPDYPQLLGTLPNHHSFAIGYVKSAIKLIEQLKKLEQAEVSDANDQDEE